MGLVSGEDGDGLAVERDVLNLVHDEVSLSYFRSCPERAAARFENLTQKAVLIPR